MKRLIGVVAMFVAAGPAFAADVATCTLGADKKTVTVTATNPYSQVMACEVNCHMAVPNGFATVVCAKPVPVGVKDWVMCTETSKDISYTRVKEVSLHCPDPSAPPPASKADSDSKDDDEDDAKIDEKMQQMMKQGQEMLQQLKKKQP